MKKTVAFCWVNQLDTLTGGVERVTHRIMDGLSKRGFNCVFLQHDIDNNRFLFNGVDVNGLGTFLNQHGIDTVVNQNGHSSRLTELMADTQWRGRYVVCHHIEPRYLQKLFDFRRTISEFLATGTSPRARLEWFVRILSYPLWRAWSNGRIAKVQEVNYQRCEQYVLLSPSFLPVFAQLIRQKSVPKAIAIPNPLSFDIRPEEAKDFVKGQEVLVVSRLEEQQKRISFALEAWAMIEQHDRDGWVLKIVGDGPDAATLQEQARRLGLKRVRFLGRQDPLPHYLTASILLMTSRVEGWGLTLTEAMQTGTVAVAFDSYLSLHDIIDDGKTGVIVRNGDVVAFAAAVLRLMSDPMQRKTLAGNALNACQKYQLEVVLDQWAAIL